MPIFNFEKNRVWTPSPYMPQEVGWERSGLYNDRPNRKPGLSTTVVRQRRSAKLTLKAFSYEWELLMLSGELEIGDKVLRAKDHCLIGAGEEISGRTLVGCEYLVINHT